MFLLLAPLASARPIPPGPVPDPVAVAASKGLARKVKADPEKYVPKLVARLVGGTDDPAVKVRRIHDWIALNITYDAASFTSGVRVPGDWETTLSRGSAVCEGYGGLFQHLAEAAGLESRVVHGYGRGVGYDPFREAAPLSSNHAWNRVKVGDAWRLLDVTWDAGTLDGEGFRRKYRTDFLFTDPSVFVRTHLPNGANAEDELLPSPVDETTFLGLVKVEPPLRADLVVEPTTPHTEVGAETIATLKVQEGLNLRAFLERADGTKVPDGAFTDRVGDQLRVRVRFPAAGDYLVRIGSQEVEGGVFEHGAVLAYTATEGHAVALPHAFSDWKDSYELVEPDGRAPGTAPRVVVRMPGVESVVLVVDGKPLPMTRDGDRFTSPEYPATATTVKVAVVVPDGWRGVVRLSGSDG